MNYEDCVKLRIVELESSPVANEKELEYWEGKLERMQKRGRRESHEQEASKL